MTKIENKALHFVTALKDVYRNEENRELNAFSAFEFSNDVTEDFTAMLIAMNLIFEQVTGTDGDLLDFTYVLNKLAVQYIMDGERRNNETD